MNKNLDEYLNRQKIYEFYGYDLEKEKEFVLNESLPINGKILEAGTGKGIFTIALAKKGFSVISFDISAEALKIAKENISNANLEKFIELKKENGENLSFENEYFGTIFSVNTFHHLENPFIFLDELVRVLSKNGKIILSDFSEEGFKMLDEIHSKQGEIHSIGKYSLKDAEKYLKSKNFNVKNINSKFQEILIAYLDDGV
jgi:ubiquinone/menaquinone biosynthesis C-methylase UbiE